MKKISSIFIIFAAFAFFVLPMRVRAVEPPDLIDVVEIVDPAPFIIHTNILPGDSFLHPMTVRNLTGSPQDVGMKLDIDLSQGIVPNPPYELEEQIFVKIERVGSGFIELPGGGQEKTLQQLSGTLIELGIIPGSGTQVYKISFVFNPNAGNEYQNTKVYFNVVMGLEVPDMPPQLKIEKFVGSEGSTFLAGQHPGDNVTYILKIKAAGGDDGEIPNQSNVNNVYVTDLPPAGFTYRSGSWTAVSTKRGNIKNSPTTEPTYASPGVWNLGTLIPGEVVTLTYITDISASQDAGVYPDSAWAKGTNSIGDQVLATFGDPVFFVGTQVAVATPTSEQVALAEKTKTDTTTKHKTIRVLGASIVLPATGSSTWWIILAGFLAVIGGGLMLLGKRKKIQANSSIKTIMKLFILALLGLGIFGLSETARAVTPDPNISVRIEDPKSPTDTGTLKIGFVTLDIQGRDLSTQCYEETAGLITTEYNHQNGGNSGNCAVDLFADGLYKFYVIASIGGDSTESNHVTVEINTGAPSTPLNYDRNSCIVAFTTANDGITSGVELYRSTSLDFIADSSTFVTSVAIAPNTNGIITDPNADCGGDFFYAIRAISATGAGSGFVGDEKVTVHHQTRTVTRTVTTGGGTTTAGAIPAAGGGAVAGENAGGTTPEGAVQGETAPAVGTPGEVAAAEIEKTAGVFNGKNAKYWWIAGALAALGIIYYVYQRSRKKQPKLPL